LTNVVTTIEERLELLKKAEECFENRKKMKGVDQWKTSLYLGKIAEKLNRPISVGFTT